MSYGLRTEEGCPAEITDDLMYVLFFPQVSKILTIELVSLRVVGRINRVSKDISSRDEGWRREKKSRSEGRKRGYVRLSWNTIVKKKILSCGGYVGLGHGFSPVTQPH